MFRFTTLSLFALSGLSHALPQNDGNQGNNGPGAFNIVSVGDSYNSAVTYNGLFGDPEYDNNKDNCMRSSIAYGYQLGLNSPKWTTSQINTVFLGCCGAQLYNIVGDPGQQLFKDPNPSIVIMHAGGNNAGFFKIARDCIYTFDAEDTNKDFRPQYKDDVGREFPCAKAIDETMDYIANPDKMYRQVDETLTDMVDKILSKSTDKNWPVFMGGYAHFFNIDAGKSDYCNQVSFSTGTKGSYYLSSELRTDMNSLMTKFNEKLNQTISEFKFSPVQKQFPAGSPNNGRIKYVSIAEAFDHHRFCEPEFNDGVTPKPLYCADNLWFWNLNLPYPAWDPCRDLHYSNGIAGKNQMAITQAGGLFKNELGAASGSIHGEPPTPDQGWMLRPFHPKAAGHLAIKDTFSRAIRAANIPGMTFPA